MIILSELRESLPRYATIVAMAVVLALVALASPTPTWV